MPLLAVRVAEAVRSMMAVYKLLGYKPSSRSIKAALACGSNQAHHERLGGTGGNEFQERISRTYLSRGRRLAAAARQRRGRLILLARHYRTPETHPRALGTASVKSEQSYVTVLGLKE